MSYKAKQLKNGNNSMIFDIVRKRSNGQLELLIIGRWSRIDVDIDCNFCSSNLAKRIEKAINRSLFEFWLVVPRSATNADRNLWNKFLKFLYQF